MKIALVYCRIDSLFDKCSAGAFSIFESNPPLGLGAIGTIAKSYGHDVRLFDQLLHEYDNKQLIQAIKEYQPDMVGFSCTSLNYNNSCYCAKSIRNEQGAIVFAGGIHITLCGDRVHNDNVFDFIIKGEGEEVFGKILEDIQLGKNLGDLKIIGYRWAKDNNDTGIAVLSNVNQPIIDREILDIRLYKNKGALLNEYPCYSLFSSRGCPYMCRFCSKPDYFKIYRERSIESVINEIKILLNQYDGKGISFREDNFTVNPERLSQFCYRMLELFDGAVPWECESRAELPAKTLKLMYKSGCRGIWCGVETIVPRWNNWINKGLDKDKVIAFYEDCREIGIRTGALFMFGFPNQTLDELEEDICFALSLPTIFSAFQCLAIFPGSPLYEYYETYPKLKYNLTDDVALALIQGKNYQDMLQMELNINQRIKSARLSYDD